MSFALFIAAAVAAPAGTATITQTSGYEAAGVCLKAIISAELYETLLGNIKGGSKASPNKEAFEAWQATFRNIFRWEGKRLGKTDQQMMDDIQVMSNDIKTNVTVGTSSNVLVSSYQQAVSKANTCRDLY